MSSVIDKLEGKRILIWGYGREGKSTENFLKRLCKPKSVSVFEGKREEINDDDYDYIFKSPGIVMEEENDKYTSQTELFLEEYRNQVVGVTGTKGKSTTSTLLYTVLKECTDREVFLLGNIGQPCLDYFEDITEDSIVVFEMSCHQLAHLRVSPRIAVFLNLFEEHLDYYGTFDKYFKAKCHVTQSQTASDYFFVGENVPPIDTQADVTKITYDQVREYPLQILGEHNHYNAEFVYRIAVNLFGCDGGKVIESMGTFTGLPHRLQKIATISGTDYYDDSISTIPEAAISAVKSVDNVQTVLLGGMDRNIDYDLIIQFIKKNSQINFICVYASGKRIYDEVKDCHNCHYVQNLEEAVKLAKQITLPGRACILSPAAASYGYFKNFEERGDVFKEYVCNSSAVHRENK